MSKWYNIQNSGRTADVHIYSDIGFGGVTAEQFVNDLNALGTVPHIDVRINSYGGSVFDGIAIYNALRRHPARIVTHVDGVAASSAAIIAMAGDERRMADNALLMIHNVWVMTAGNADDLERETATLRKIDAQLVNIFTERHGNREQVVTWLNVETWFTADEAIAARFATATDGPASGITHDVRARVHAYMNARKSRPVDRNQIERAKKLLDIDNDAIASGKQQSTWNAIARRYGDEATTHAMGGRPQAGTTPQGKRVSDERLQELAGMIGRRI